MNSSVEASHLSTQITVVNKFSNLLLIGNGRNFAVHDQVTNLLLSTIPIFHKVSIRGISVTEFEVANNEECVLLLIWGQRSFAVTKLCLKSAVCSIVVSEQVCEDWIISGALLEAVPEGDGICVEFALLTAHSALLLYSFGKLHNAHKSNQKSLYQILEEKDIEVFNSYQSLYLEKKVQCKEQCILFSGVIIVKESISAKTKKCYISIDEKWKGNLVCFGGTAFGNLIIWTLDGTNENGCIIPNHRISAHQGVIFSVNWCKELKLISTTSDDRKVKVWNVSFLTSCQHSSIKDTLLCWECSEIEFQESFDGHLARIWKSVIIPKKVNSVSFDTLLSVGEDSNICCWNLTSKELLFCWRAHDGASAWCIETLSIVNDLIILTGGSDGAVKKWSLIALISSNKSIEATQQLPWLNIQLSEKKYICKKGKEKTDTQVKNICEDVSNISIVNTFKEEATFIRCLSLMSSSECIVCLDNGDVWLWTPNAKENRSCVKNTITSTESIEGLSIETKEELQDWKLIMRETNLSGYSLISSYSDGSFESDVSCIGSLYGHLYIVQRCEAQYKVYCAAQTNQINSKVFALKWLTSTQLLVCYPNGLLVLYYFDSKLFSLSPIFTYELPTSKQRWFTSACLLSSTKVPSVNSMLIGDRCGSIHLYSLREKSPVLSLRGIHGTGGVVSMQIIDNNVAVSTGRDGYIRSWVLKSNDDASLYLEQIIASRHTGGSWVARIIQSKEDKFIVAFHDVYLQVWSEKSVAHVTQIECGGGHRSWDVAVQDTHSNSTELVCVFIKDGKLHNACIPLSSHLTPVMSSLASKTIQCCSLLKTTRNNGSLFAIGGEDNALRLVHMLNDGHCSLLETIHSHISAIRSITVIKNGEKDGYIWFISAGGRAQTKVWRLNIKTSLGGFFNCDNDENTSEGEQIRDTRNNYVECSEIYNHQLLDTKTNVSWRHQQTRMSPETRHMSCSGIWYSTKVAIFVVASSDATCRIYYWVTHSNKQNSLKSIAEIKGTHCFLNVDIKSVQYETVERNKHHLKHFIIRTTDTAGNLTYHYLQTTSFEDSEVDADLKFQSSEPYCIASYKLNQSGINAISSISVCVDELSHLIPFTIDERKLCIAHSGLILTGGDDNEIILSKMIMTLDEGVSVEQPVDEIPFRPSIRVTAIGRGVAHCAQITGLRWLSVKRFMSTSVDQKITIWNIVNQPTSAASVLSKVSLVPIKSIFSSVADIHGLTMLKCTNEYQVEEDKYLEPCLNCERNKLVEECCDDESDPIKIENTCVSNNMSIKFVVFGTGLETFNACDF